MSQKQFLKVFSEQQLSQSLLFHAADVPPQHNIPVHQPKIENDATFNHAFGLCSIRFPTHSNLLWDNQRNCNRSIYFHNDTVSYPSALQLFSGDFHSKFLLQMHLTWKVVIHVLTCKNKTFSGKGS